jgi:hypothetical protein
MMRESKIIKSQDKFNFWVFSGCKRKMSKKVKNDEKSKKINFWILFRIKCQKGGNDKEGSNNDEKGRNG